MFVASTLNSLPRVVGLHEGHSPGHLPIQQLPLINLQNRKAWYNCDYAEQTVAATRDLATLSSAAGDAEMLVDVAFYNAPLLVALAKQHPDSMLFVIFRRCEGFVRSATIVRGEDRQPAGWPDRSKPLTDRERFVELGRLKPELGSDDDDQWSKWSAIQRNIWLWHTVNSHLLSVAESHANCHTLHYEDLVDDPRHFWAHFLRKLKLFTESNLDQCVERSAKKVNQRPSYQVGASDTWDPVELAFYEQLAHPLERKLYDRPAATTDY